MVRCIDTSPQELPLRVAVAATKALEPWTRGLGRLKWPNDIMLDGRKLGGILVDVFGQPDEQPAVVISFGVNIAASREVSCVPNSVSLGLPSSAPLLAEIATALFKTVDEFTHHSIEFSAPQGQGGILEDYRRLSAHRAGDIMRCCHHGRVVEGAFVGIDPRGFLQLDIDGTKTTLVTGELDA